MSKPVGVSCVNHFLNMLNHSFVRYFALSIASWEICCTYRLVNIKGLAEVFPSFASELSISVRYYVLWHTPVWVYMIEKLADKVFGGSILCEWKYLDILGESVNDYQNLVIG